MYFTMETRLFRAPVIDWLLWRSVSPSRRAYDSSPADLVTGFENTCCRVPEWRPHTVRSCAQAKDPQLINRIALVNDISIVRDEFLDLSLSSLIACYVTCPPNEDSRSKPGRLVYVGKASRLTSLLLRSNFPVIWGQVQGRGLGSLAIELDSLIRDLSPNEDSRSKPGRLA